MVYQKLGVKILPIRIQGFNQQKTHVTWPIPHTAKAGSEFVQIVPDFKVNKPVKPVIVRIITPFAGLVLFHSGFEAVAITQIQRTIDASVGQNVEPVFIVFC